MNSEKVRAQLVEILDELQESRKRIDSLLQEYHDVDGRITKKLDEVNKRHARELDELNGLKERVEKRRRGMILARSENVNGTAEANRQLKILDSLNK